MNDAVKLSPPTNEEAAFVDAVRQGVAAADAGRTVPYEEVRRWLNTWGSEEELPPPECR